MNEDEEGVNSVEERMIPKFDREKSMLQVRVLEAEWHRRVEMEKVRILEECLRKVLEGKRVG